MYHSCLSVGLNLGPELYCINHTPGDGVAGKFTNVSELVSLICLVMVYWSVHGSDKLNVTPEFV